MGVGIYKIKFKIKQLRNYIMYLVLHIFPINNQKVISINYYGQGYGDNAKYVCDALISLDPDISVIWALQKGVALGKAPHQIKGIRYPSLAFFYHLATAKIWLSNARVPCMFKKRKQQYYIQLWHGMPALKRIEADALGALSQEYIQAAKHDSQLANLFISDGKYWTRFVKKTFWYDGPVLECGTPRMDKLINRTEKTKNNIKEKLHITADKVLLYAPTFRKDMNLECYFWDYQNLKHTLENKTGNTWHLCVRLHPNVTRAGISLPEIEGITDFSKYPDMYELMEMTDLFITDYSSTMFEAGFANIPVILFATDIEEYRKDRNFYFKFEELPFPVVISNEELLEKIKHWNTNDYMHAVTQFKNKLEIKETGTASKQVAQHILKIIGLKEK